MDKLIFIIAWTPLVLISIGYFWQYINLLDEYIRVKVERDHYYRLLLEGEHENDILKIEELKRQLRACATFETKVVKRINKMIKRKLGKYEDSKAN